MHSLLEIDLARAMVDERLRAAHRRRLVDETVGDPPTQPARRRRRSRLVLAVAAAILLLAALPLTAFGETSGPPQAGTTSPFIPPTPPPWRVTVRLIGAGQVTDGQDFTCTSNAAEPGENGGSCSHIYDPRLVCIFDHCTFLPRVVTLSATQAPTWQGQPSFDPGGCDRTQAGRCELDLTVQGGERSVTVRFGDEDRDDDGYTRFEDCDDRDRRVNPGGYDVPHNGIDEDCRGGDNRDRDGDRYDKQTQEPGREDCDDGNPAIHPNAVDRPDNGLDEDCNGVDAVQADRDGDGYSRPADCRDDLPGVHPNARDIPRNGADEDCDGGDDDYAVAAADIRHGERGAGRFTTIHRMLATRVPAGARITLRCKGDGCRFRRRALPPMPPRKSVSLTQWLRGAKLAPGARVEVAVRAPAAYGKALRLTMRNRAAPKVTWLKVDPVTGAFSRW